MNFVHLHGHSTFSFLEAIGKPNKIIAKAKELGMDAIALTDYNGMYGCIKLYQTAKDEGVKAIIGVELGFVLDYMSPTPPAHIGNIVLLAANSAGYANLMEIVSFADKTGVQGKPKLDINTLQEYHEGIIAIMGGKESRIGKMMLNQEKEEKVEEILAMIKQRLGEENVYLEVTAQDEGKVPDTQKVNTAIIALSEKTKTPCVVDNNYHYINENDKEAREIALAIKDGKKVYDEDRRKPQGEFFIMGEDEIRKVCLKNGYSEQQITQWIETNLSIAEKVVTEIALGQTLFPNYASPEDIVQLYEENKEQLVVEE